jgi:uncharacterized Zn finger protein
MSWYGDWKPKPKVAEQARQAEKQLAKLERKGQRCQPIHKMDGLKIAHSVWGKAWCSHMEARAEYSNRLGRGRSYVRHGCVIDLSLSAGQIKALVSGSELYKVTITVKPVETPVWQQIVKDCTGQIASIIEVLQGKLSQSVMEVVSRPGQGLLPLPQQIKFDCSCPDYTELCKHVAATLYGIGARLDHAPELLFELRGVSPQDLIQTLADAPTDQTSPVDALQNADTDDLSALFGIDLTGMGDAPALPKPAKPSKSKAAAVPTQKVTVAKKKPASQSVQAAAPLSKAKPSPRPKTITAQALIKQGIPRHKIQAWLKAEILKPTEQRGVYLTTGRTQNSVKLYLSTSDQA